MTGINIGQLGDLGVPTQVLKHHTPNSGIAHTDVTACAEHKMRQIEPLRESRRLCQDIGRRRRDEIVGSASDPQRGMLRHRLSSPYKRASRRGEQRQRLFPSPTRVGMCRAGALRAPVFGWMFDLFFY